MTQEIEIEIEIEYYREKKTPDRQMDNRRIVGTVEIHAQPRSKHSRGESVSVLTSLVRKISFRGIDLLSRSATPDYHVNKNNKKEKKERKRRGGERQKDNKTESYDRGNCTQFTNVRSFVPSKRGSNNLFPQYAGFPLRNECFCALNAMVSQWQTFLPRLRFLLSLNFT